MEANTNGANRETMQLQVKNCVNRRIRRDGIRAYPASTARCVTPISLCYANGRTIPVVTLRHFLRLINLVNVEEIA